MLSLLMSLAGAGTPWTAVGHDEVIKMQYFIGIGKLEAGVVQIPLAWTTSYNVGVSLSEIKWGFWNPSEAGTNSSAFLEFTLHDIAGTTLSNFVRIKSGEYCIFFRGPTSSGFPWWGQWAIYYPEQSGCDLQFSQTQGFTYKFTGKPIGELSKSKLVSVSSTLPINGINESNVAHGNTFEDYLKEIEVKWNKMLVESPDKANSAKIKLQMRPKEGDNDAALKQSPVMTEKENKGQNLNRAGDPGAKVLPIQFTQFDSIASIIKRFWQERFVPSEVDPTKPIDKNSKLEVNYVKYEGGANIIDIKCHRSTITDQVPNTHMVCVGTDKVCKGFAYRAQIAAMNFKGLYTLMAADKMTSTYGTGSMEVQAQGGHQGPPVAHTKDRNVEDTTQKEATSATLKWVNGIGAGVNPLYDGWSEFRTLMNNRGTADFTIDLDMPYTFAFTPKVHGGLLKDSIEGEPMCGIDLKEGVFLLFWWYTDPNCQSVMLIPEFSTRYRITKVQHSIGLSGNTTQLSISHQNSGLT